MGELSARFNWEERDIADAPVSSRQLAGPAAPIAYGTLSGSSLGMSRRHLGG
jgi:hypothetical protein